MGVLAALLAAAAVASTQPAVSSERAIVLTGENRLVSITLSDGRIAATRALGKARTRVEGGRMIAFGAARGRVFVLVQAGRGTDSVAAVDVLRRTPRIVAYYPLEPDVRYRGLVFGNGRLYVYGGRWGRIIDEQNGIREQTAVVTVLHAGTGRNLGTTTIRPAEGHMWWIYWGSISDDGTQLALSYHGGCGGANTELCTSGADWIDITDGGLRRCDVPAPRRWLGCMPNAHGMVEPHGSAWIAATGTEELLELGPRGRVIRSLHSDLENAHVMSISFTRDGQGLYVPGSCLQSRGGLRRLDVVTGRSVVVRRSGCGERVLPGRTRLVYLRVGAVELRDPGSARLRRTLPFSARVLDAVLTD